MSTFGQRLRVATRAAIGIFSDDSMKRAYGMLTGILPGGVGTPPIRGTADYLRAYSQMPWLRAVASRVSTATGRADWKLYATGKKDERARRNKAIQRAGREDRQLMLKEAARKDELKEITDHPLLELLHNANEFQTGFQMRKVTQLHLDLVGDAFWMKERDNQGTVVAVWPIPPHWIMSTPTPAFRFYRVNFRAWRGVIPDTEFLWFSDPDPLNPYGRGSGSAMSLGDELDTDEYAARMTKSFFYNHARPDLIVWPKGESGNIREASIKRLEEDWMSQSQGFFRAFKPYFLNREVEVKELDQNFRSLMLVQLREFERNVVMQHFGIPPEILGVLSSSNRATIDAADYFMSRYVVEPRLEFQRTIMQERLVPEYDERLILDFVSPTQEDKDFHLRVAQAAPWSLTVNEWREIQGRPELKDKAAGDLHPTSGQTFGKIEEAPDPIEQAQAMAAAGLGPGAPGGDEDDKKDEKEKDEKTPVPPGKKDVDVLAALDAGDNALATLLRKSVAEVELPASSAQAARLEPAFQRALTRTWREFADGIAVERLAALGFDEDAIIEALDLDDVERRQADTVREHLTRAALRGTDLGAMSIRRAGIAVRAPKRMVVNLNHVNQRATAWAETRAAQLVRAEPAVREVIRLMVAEANASGVTTRELAEFIQTTVGLTPRQMLSVRNFEARLRSEGLSEAAIRRRVTRYAEAQHRARALTIARTELNAALNAGQQMVWDEGIQQGVIDAKEFSKTWITTPDERLEEHCEALDGTTVAIDEDFVPGVANPPLHPNCRCAMGLVRKAPTRKAEKVRDAEGAVP